MNIYFVKLIFPHFLQDRLIQFGREDNKSLRNLGTYLDGESSQVPPTDVPFTTIITILLPLFYHCAD